MSEKEKQGFVHYSKCCNTCIHSEQYRRAKISASGNQYTILSYRKCAFGNFRLPRIKDTVCEEWKFGNHDIFIIT
jgi:hypothetical protein